VLFVDYAKAFDPVDRTTVLLKMAALGVDPKLLKWMHSFLFQRQQRVKIGHVFSMVECLKEPGLAPTYFLCSLTTWKPTCQPSSSLMMLR
jgi:hypothetical protein